MNIEVLSFWGSLSLTCPLIALTSFFFTGFSSEINFLINNLLPPATSAVVFCLLHMLTYICWEIAFMNLKYSWNLMLLKANPWQRFLWSFIVKSQCQYQDALLIFQRTFFPQCIAFECFVLTGYQEQDMEGYSRSPRHWCIIKCSIYSSETLYQEPFTLWMPFWSRRHWSPTYNQPSWGWDQEKEYQSCTSAITRFGFSILCILIVKIWGFFFNLFVFIT